jgi:ribulose-5-phosphate 4-epimerase/fuculose-1-phosphate aldolase
MGAIPLADYATPSTEEVARSLAPFIQSSDAILLANHGVVTYGPDLLDAYFKMEKVEHAAHIMFVARMLGGEHLLTDEDVEKLRKISVETYGKDFSEKVACDSGPDEDTQLSDEEVRRYVAEKLQALVIS